MKKRFLIYHLFIVCVLHGSVLADQAVSDYEQIECTIIPISLHVQRNSFKTEHSSHPHIPAPQLSETRLPANQATSTNWSGYVAATNLAKPAKNSVTAVFGSWIVPTVVPAHNNTYSAFWIGIDGYNSPTVEQIGTAHDFVNGVVQHYAWFEMYPGGSYSINGFPLHPGDVISASVKFTGNNIFTMTIYNNTQKVSTTIPTSYTKSTTAQRSCAEWVVEAPYLNGILPLTDFVTAYIWGCMATINGVTGSINNPKWQNAGITMITDAGASKAIPSSLLQDNGSFFVTWAHQ